MGEPGRRRDEVGCGLGVLALVGLCGCAGSPLGGGVSLDRIAGEVRLEAEHRDESFRGTAVTSATKENLFRENVKLDFDGNVYHRRLMTFGGVVDLGLEQRETRRSGGNTLRSDDDNNRYDVHTMFFKDLPYSGRLFAQRSQIRIQQSFFPTNEAVVTRHGATLMAKDWWIPSQLEAAEYEFRGKAGDLRREHRDSASLTGFRSSERFDVNYRLDSQDVESDLSGGSYDDRQAFASGTWRFGKDGANSLSIDGRHRTQRGDIVNDNTGATGRARFALTRDLENLTSVAVDRSEIGTTGENRTDRLDLQTGLTHRLYKSLVTNLTGTYVEQSFGEGDLDRFGVDFRTDYTKKTPFGRILAGLRLGQSRQDETGRIGSRVTISNEAHVFSPGNPILLANPNVEEPSIIVTDASGSTVYSTPLDYTVQQIGVNTRLVIPIGSRIVPAQTILVSYVYRPSVERVFESRSRGANLEFAFGEYLSIGGYWLTIDQDLVSGFDPGTLDRVDEFGLNLKVNVAKQRLSLEHMERDSLLTPLRRTRFSWDTWVRPDPGIGVSASASAYHLRFTDQAESERGASVIGNIDWRVNTKLFLQARAEYRYSDLRTESGDGVFFSGRANYDYGETSMSLEILSSQEDWDVSSDRDILRVLLTVRRRF